MDALALAALGYPVFPCQPGEKAPHRYLAPNGFKNATREPRLIRDWWERAPNAPIGLVPPKDVLVLDIDSRSASERFLDDFEEFLDFPQARSGSGGLHIYCRVTREIVNRGRAMPEYLLDLKGCGKGYVLAPPSPHPSGNSYQWEVELVALHNLPLIPPRFWQRVLERIGLERIGGGAGTSTTYKADYITTSSKATKKQVEAAHEELYRRAAKLASATPGERHNCLRSSAWALSRWVLYGALEPEEIRCRLMAAGHVAGLSDPELTAAIDSAIEKGPAYFATQGRTE